MLSSENGTGMYMPVAPAYGYGNNGGFGMGGDWAGGMVSSAKNL